MQQFIQTLRLFWAGFLVVRASRVLHRYQYFTEAAVLLETIATVCQMEIKKRQSFNKKQ